MKLHSYMKHTVLVGLAIGLLTTGIGSASAASCNPKSTDDLKRLLAKHSPFKGTWKHVKSGYQGPVRFYANGSTYHLQTSNVNRQFVAKIRVAVQFRSARKISFSNSGGPFTLTLTSKCTLQGVQRHRNGRVQIYLR